MAARIRPYEVPVDGNWHPIDMYGEIVHVAARTPHAVEFWAWDRRRVNAETHVFRVFATGEEMPMVDGADVVHVGTAITEDGRFVRHLIERVD
jgi:hypothetical protein